jgi:membrane-bound lytic murein transglycosylase D
MGKTRDSIHGVGMRIAIGAGTCGMLLLLAGCPQDGQTGSAGASPHTTAPALAGNSGSGAQGQSTRRPAQTSQGTPLEAKPTPSADTGSTAREQGLIEEVERTYQSGMQHYSAGDLAAAKSDFDHAVDIMLTSGFDLKQGTGVGAEFEHIVDAVNTLELDSLRQGNGFAPPQKDEQTPVDLANDVTFPVDPNVKATAEAELKTTQSDLPLVINDAVASYISFFSNTPSGRATIINSLTRAGRYKAIIQKTLQEEGVPQDLIYQAIAESGFKPQALNARSGAAGMWQFMPFNDYGLTRTAWYDERFDPEKSTRAYAREIKKMYNQLGDWYLAMAGYDWGPGNVQRAVQRTGYADFWELYRRNNLPAETKNYVPIILAAAIMAKNPQQYGLTNVIPDAPLITDTVTVNAATDLRLVADIVGAPVQEIAAINPALLRTSTPPDTAYPLHLPAGTKDLFTRTIAGIPEDKRASWRYHKLQPGDTLDAIARTYHVTAAEIAFVNQIQPDADLASANTQIDALVIPVAPVAASAHNNTRYRVQRGDTLVTVADRFDVTPEQLRRWNHLRAGSVVAGKYLFVAEPAHIAVRAKGRGGAASRASGSGRAARGRRATGSSSGSSSKKMAAHATNHVKGQTSKSAHTSSKKTLHKK